MRKFLAGLAAGAVAVCAGYAIASRNSAGNMAAVNGPYVAGTTISSSAINARFADIESEITASLSRDAKGGMRSALRGIDGTVTAPALSFTSETGTGFYRIGASDLGLSLGGSKVHEWTATGETVVGMLGVGAAPVNQFDVTVPGTASTNLGAWLEPSLADGNTLQAFFGKSTTGGGTGILAYTKNATAANSTFCLGVFAGSANTLCVDGNNKTTIGSGGTPISASFRGTVTWDPPSLGAGSSATTTITLTGAAAGADCNVTPPSSIGTPYDVVPTCWVTLNTCNIQIVSAFGTNDMPSGTWACRVWNP